MDDINLVPPGIVTLLLIIVGTLTLLTRVNLSINSHFQKLVSNLKLFERFGLGQNTLTHMMFIMVSYMWVFSVIISYLYRLPVNDGFWSMGWLVLNLGISIILSLPLTLTTLYFFREKSQEKIKQENKKFVGIDSFSGQVCHVTSNVVNERVGEAKVSDDGEVLKVRCQPGEILHKGDVALIVEFDDQLKLFWVEPYSDPFA